MKRNIVINTRSSELDAPKWDSTNALLLFSNLFRPILT